MNLNAALTNREAQITAYIAWGASKKQVANKFGISLRTVENHARSIYAKTGVTSVGQLSAWYFCKNYNIPLNVSPIKNLLTLALLTAIVPVELKQAENMICRTMKSVTIRYTGRSSRRERNYYSKLFQYEN